MEYINRRVGRGRPTQVAMATLDGTGRGRARQVRLLPSVAVFFLLSSFLLLAVIISFVTNYSNIWGEAKWDGTGREDAGTAMRDGKGGRRVGGGGRKREEGGLAGNMGTAEAEGQVTKGCEWELRGADSDGRRGR